MDDIERGRILGHREAAVLAAKVLGCECEIGETGKCHRCLMAPRIIALSALPSDLVVANLESLRYAIIATDQRCLPAYDSERFGLAWQDIYDTVQAARTRAAPAKETP